MQRHNIYDTSLALAGVSFVTIVSALSVSSYDWPLITGVAILCIATPLLGSFSRWTPPDIEGNSPWYDWLANHLFLVAMPGALVGMAFIFAHVHFVCGLLFALSSFAAISLYWRRVLQLQTRASDDPPKA